jgi:hypothetical protein
MNTSNSTDQPGSLPRASQPPHEAGMRVFFSYRCAANKMSHVVVHDSRKKCTARLTPRTTPLAAQSNGDSLSDARRNLGPQQLDRAHELGVSKHATVQKNGQAGNAAEGLTFANDLIRDGFGTADH